MPRDIMNSEIQRKLMQLQSDYSQVKGHPFAYFFCPILHVDEESPLCLGHIVNKVFSDSTRKTVVQRKDVDGFFGTNFEADFTDLEYRERGLSGRTLTDKKFSKKFRPTILLNDKPIDYYAAKGSIPQGHTLLDFQEGSQTIKLGLKIPPRKALEDQKWEIAISKDIRIPTMVSLIKAAHLTLFEMLGYRYALSLGGHYVGRQILGEFYLQNIGNSKGKVAENSLPYFREFAHMVRPLAKNLEELRGTATDGLVFLCRTNNDPPWAFIVLVRVSNSIHAVLVPILDTQDSVAKFMQFMNNSDNTIESTLCGYEQDKWMIYINQKFKLHWPKDGTLYP